MQLLETHQVDFCAITISVSFGAEVTTLFVSVSKTRKGGHVPFKD